MCGFIFSNTKNLESNLSSLTAISHRGDQKNEYEIFNNLFFGHKRLAIEGTDNGKQPLFNENKTLIAIVNGEFYNYKEIRNNLINLGHKFRTNSDSEILLHLYENYGVECLKHLHGEFSFVLYDSNQNKIFAARDRFGIKPIHYFIKDKKIIICSEAKSIIKYQKQKLNIKSLNFALSIQYLPIGKTLFEDIQVIKPGNFIILDLNNFSYREHQYWNINYEKQDMDFNFAVSNVKELLLKACQKRIPKEVSFCTHLSGGLDSSIVSLLSNTKNSYTVGFVDNDFYNESELAKIVSEKINTKLNIINLSYDNLFNEIEKSVYFSEGLAINAHLPAKLLLNKKIKEDGFKVSLTGEGSDEFFMGYAHLIKDYFGSVNKNMDYLNNIHISNEMNSQLINMDEFKSIGGVPTWLNTKFSSFKKLQSILNHEVVFDAQEFLNCDIPTATFVEKSSFLWNKYCLSGYILKTLDDGISMSQTIESRLPFLDTELVEFTTSIPTKFYFKEGMDKPILREAFKNELPNEIICRQKHPFLSPNILNLNKEKVLARILESNLTTKLGIVNKNKVLSIADELFANESICFYLLTLAIFVDCFNIEF